MHLVLKESVELTCACKSTCQRKGKCPCKSAGVFCGQSCTCGSRRKPCRNKVTECISISIFHDGSNLSLAEQRTFAQRSQRRGEEVAGNLHGWKNTGTPFLVNNYISLCFNQDFVLTANSGLAEASDSSLLQ